MRQLSAQRASFEPAHEFPMNAGPGQGDLNHLLVLAIAPPIVHRRSMPQPARIVVVDREKFSPPVEKEETPDSGFVPVQERAKHPTTVGYRKLFADPGQWRLLWWGEFKEILAPQLAHPERLRDTYRIPCYVQVLETEREVAISELASIYKSDIRPASLYFLTDGIARKLDLVLPLRAVPAQNSPRPPNTLLPHERVFRLIVANDPTIDIANSKNKLQTSTSLKCAIPARFIKEWEFKISRDEALYDMNAKSTLSGLIAKIGRRLRVGKRRNEFGKWQVLLTGKDTDEQLWAVRPPEGRLTDSLVRDWAGKTLALGGYDANKMIVEWEIFWRRRGL
jgi:hypothetical protein